MSARPAGHEPAPHRLPPGELVRVYVWEWPVRLTHWLTAYAIFVLACTGFYIGHPFIVASGPAGQHFVMGWAKTIHSYVAIVFALSVVSRVLWMFMGNTYSQVGQVRPGDATAARGARARASATTSSGSASPRGSWGTTRSRGSPTCSCSCCTS